MILACFQQERFWLQERERYLAFAPTSQVAVVMGPAGQLHPGDRRVLLRSYPADHPLATEWIVAVVCEGLVATIVAGNEADSPLGPRDRRFEAFWSFQPAGVVRILAAIREVIGRDDPLDAFAVRMLERVRIEASRSGLAARLGEGLVRIMEDVRAAEEAAASAMKERANLQALGLLAGGVGHDLANILGAIALSTDLAEAEPANPEHFDAIRQGVEAGERLTRFLRNAAGRRPLGLERTPFSAVARDAVRLLQPTCPPGIEVRSEFAEDGQTLVEADRVQLLQVAMNLLTNARQAIDGEGSVQVRVAPADGGVVLEVRDSGRGIPPERLHDIFAAGYTTRADQGGSGLGLAIVSATVSLLGGRVDVQSQPGAGTAFGVWLPAAT
jgi:signal transduction histidine kinase